MPGGQPVQHRFQFWWIFFVCSLEVAASKAPGHTAWAICVNNFRLPKFAESKYKRHISTMSSEQFSTCLTFHLISLTRIKEL